MNNDTRCPSSDRTTKNLLQPGEGTEGVRLLGLALQIVNSPGPDRECRDIVAGQTLTIGRDRDVNFAVLCDDKLSRRHFSITCFNGSVVIHDHGSRNGTYVNGVRVSTQIVQHGDQIAAGQTTMTVHLMIR